jgi:uncharacterized protein YbaP (TraB family)
MGIKTPERSDPFWKGIFMLQKFVLKSKFSIALFVCFLPAFFFTTPFGLHAKSAAVQQTSKSCLWTVQTPSNKIYLLGSLHLMKPDDYPLSASMNKAYAESQMVVFETDLEAMQQPAMLMKIQQMGLYPQGENLLQNLDPNTRKGLKKKLADLGLPLEIYVRLKPWLVATDLAVQELKKLGFNPIYGVDVYFFNKAKADGKQIGFLEPVEFQINLLGNLDKQAQNDFLSQTLKDLEVVNVLAMDLIESWKNGDARKLHELLNESFKDYPDLHERLLIQRNKNWVKEIEGAMGKNKNVLFVVGAGHLVGPQSVIDLLEKKGYRAKQQ